MNGTRRFRLFVSSIFALLLVAAPAWGQTLYSVAQDDAQLRTMDTSTAQTLSSVTMTLAGQTILGATGLAAHPATGQLFVILRLQGVAGRVLGTVNPTTGVVTQIGNMGDAFAGLAFSCAGVLYGVTGDGANVPESFFSVNQATGATTLIGAFGMGDDGETIGFNPVDNQMYHASGHDGVCTDPDNGVCFERFNPTVAPLALTNIDISTTMLIDEEAQALTFETSTGMFLWKQGHFPGPMFRVNPSTGAATRIGALDTDHQTKGLAYVPSSCGPGAATDFSIATTSPSNLVLTVRPGEAGTFMVALNPIPAGSTFANDVTTSCTTSPLVGTCSTPGTIPAGTGATMFAVTVTPTIFGSAPPIVGNPTLWLWLAAFALTLVAAGMLGRRRLPRAGYAVSFGIVLLVASLAMFQSACAGSTGQRLQGPYQVTVTATSGGITHSTSATYNVSR